MYRYGRGAFCTYTIGQKHHLVLGLINVLVYEVLYREIKVDFLERGN